MILLKRKTNLLIGAWCFWIILLIQFVDLPIPLMLPILYTLCHLILHFNVLAAFIFGCFLKVCVLKSDLPAEMVIIVILGSALILAKNHAKVHYFYIFIF